ncbi:hypothetical protein VTL71DRAFT_647 [Oculimacula yallundae]|uniref:Uncharacterized protein n=1 Tax=Oculimacula yallundae TaxID=86028 RepID=A0ABR4D0R1_9HELO
MDYSTRSFNNSAGARSDKQLSPTASVLSVQSTRSYVPSDPSRSLQAYNFSPDYNQGGGVSLFRPPHISALSTGQTAGQAQSGQHQGQPQDSAQNSVNSAGQNTSQAHGGQQRGQDLNSFNNSFQTSSHNNSQAQCDPQQAHAHAYSQNSPRNSSPKNITQPPQGQNQLQNQPSPLGSNSVPSQGRYQDRNSPGDSVRSSDQNIDRAQSGPPPSQYYNQKKTPPHGSNSGQDQGQSQALNLGQNQNISQGDNRARSHGQTLDQSQHSWQDHEPGHSQGQQSQGPISSQIQGPPQFQSPDISVFQSAASARSQTQSRDQPQGQSQPQSQIHPQNQNPIHPPQGQIHSLHRRQSSASRMNPAVPAFQPIYQTSIQTPQPKQDTIFNSHVSQPQQLPNLQHPSYLPQLPQSIQMPQPPQTTQFPYTQQHPQAVPQPFEKIMSTSQDQHSKVNDLLRKIKSVDNMNPSKQEGLVESVKELGRIYDQFARNMKVDIEKLLLERETSQGYLNNCAVNLRQAYVDRDKLGAERDAAREATEKLEAKNAELRKRLKDLENQWDRLNQEMNQKLAEKDAEIERNGAQLERQRAQLEKNKSDLTYSQERDARFVDAARTKYLGENAAIVIPSRRNTQSFGQDPFSSPSVASSSTFPVSGKGGPGSSTSGNRIGLIGRGFGQSSAFGHVQPNSGPPNATAEEIFPDLRIQTQTLSRRKPTMPTARPTRGRAEFPGSPWDTESSRVYNTEPGDTPVATSQSTALVLSSVGSDDPSQFYQEEFAGLYQLIEGWAMAYCTTPKISNDQSIARTNQVLWAFMMRCTYPGKRQDAHTHLTTLLNNAYTRPWFVVRMAVEYIVVEMLSVNSYKKFSPQVGVELSAVETKLKERGLANDARQALIDRRAKAIQFAVGNPHWEAYRGEQLSNHSRQLRDILGPMLDDKADRSKAGKDLGYIALKAWDISEHMNTSQLTFQLNFPETAGKFVAATMISKDDDDVHPMTLQLSQARLKLIITPVITMRDDRGTTIKAKNLHFATVLTMK